MAPVPNPIVSGFHPDPSVCRVGEDYYLINSSFTWLPGVPVFHSRDLREWNQIGNVLERPSQVDMAGTDVWASFGIFAPTLRYHEDRFWMITTCFSVSGSTNFFVTADEPSGPWSDPIEIDIDGIDPDLAWDEDGNCWVHYSGPGQGILRCRIDDVTGAVLDGPVQTWSGTGCQHPEAPHLYRIGEWWYLMIAEGGTGSGHCVSIARSSDPTGPWEGCPSNPVLSHRSMANPIQNTGHGDLVRDVDGQWWMTLLGVRPKGMPASYHVLGRETFLTRVDWHDGWPVVQSPELLVSDDAEIFVETFGGTELDAGWLSRRRFPSDVADLGSAAGVLTLLDDASTPRSARPTFLGRRQRHHLCDVETTVVVESGEAGLALVYDESAFCKVGIDGDGIFASALIGPAEHEFGRGPKPAGPATLAIRVVEGVGGPDALLLGYEGDDGDFCQLGSVDGRYFSSEVVGGFLGRVIGVYASASEAVFSSLCYRAR